MLVYGDQSETIDPRERLAEIGEQLARVSKTPAGLGRHSSLVAALIAAGQLLQGVADTDAPSDELDDFVFRLARAVVRSVDTRLESIGELPRVPGGEVPRWVEARLPEGFAFYAVYPDAYVEAARKLRLVGEPRVIGIRSIGTTVGAVVAAALEASRPTSVRPFGDPFARKVELPLSLISDDAHYVIVDEGPGLSGSSFGGVADWLEDRGVPSERIAFLPSHDGEPGPQASARHRDRWRRAQRVAAAFRPDFLEEQFGPIERFSTGSPGERLKYLGRHNGYPVLLKFAGLGEIGERKLAMARALHAAGLVPEPITLVHGFIVERWCADARPLERHEAPVEEIGRYIGARARLFPAGTNSGASISELSEMCRRNLSLALGQEAARALDRCNPAELSARVQRVRTDNKLDREEWLRTPDGRLLKTDALDHHCAHDLIGCQNLAWDVAGAIVEFDLRADERMRLIDSAERASGGHVDAQLLQFCILAYCSFRLGQASLCGGPHDQYQTRLLDLLQHASPATPQDSSIV